MHGGRVVFVCSRAAEKNATAHADTCILLDVGCWTDDMSLCVSNRFPGVEIAVEQSRCSLTGFCVAMKLQNPVTCFTKNNSAGTRKIFLLYLAAAAVSALVIISYAATMYFA